MDGHLFINDSFIETDDKKESINPATEQSIGEFSLASSDLCREAVQAAADAFPTWAALPVDQKRKALPMPNPTSLKSWVAWKRWIITAKI